LLAAVFYVGGLAAWIWARKEENKRWILGLALASFALALLGKEHAITWPCAVFVYEMYRRLSGAKDKGSNPPVWAMGAVLGIIALYFWARAAVFATAFGWQVPPVDNPLVEHGFSERFLTAGAIYFRYLQLLIAPVQLSADYSAHAIPIVSSWTDGDAVTGLIFFALTVVVLAASVYTHHAIAACTALFLGLYLFVGNLLFLIPIIMAERLMYLPSVGWCGLVGLLVAEIFMAPQRSRVFFVIGCIVMFSGYAVRSFSRTMDWRDDFTLFKKTAKAVPNSARAQYNFGFALMKKGNMKEAAHYLEKSNELVPEDADVLNALGTIQWNRRDAKGALNFYQRSLASRPNALALANLCRASLAAGQLAQALRSCPVAAARFPKNAMVKHFWGLALAQDGQTANAIRVLEQAVEIEPENSAIVRDLKRVRARVSIRAPGPPGGL
jgi:tetratricopeptide (TPR) repeat protein